MVGIPMGIHKVIKNVVDNFFVLIPVSAPMLGTDPVAKGDLRTAIDHTRRNSPVKAGWFCITHCKVSTFLAIVRFCPDYSGAIPKGIHRVIKKAVDYFAAFVPTADPVLGIALIAEPGLRTAIDRR